MDNAPAPIDPLTLDQRAMRAARLFDESKEANPKGRTSLADISKQENVPQTWMGLASFIREHCPKEAQAVEDGTRTLFDLEPTAQQRYKANRKPLQKKALGLAAPGTIYSGPAKAPGGVPITQLSSK